MTNIVTGLTMGKFSLCIQTFMFHVENRVWSYTTFESIVSVIANIIKRLICFKHWAIICYEYVMK